MACKINKANKRTKCVKVNFEVCNYNPDLSKKEFKESIKEDIDRFMEDSIISVMTDVTDFKIVEE